MSNFSGTWKMKSSENFDELLKALGEYHTVGGIEGFSSRDDISDYSQSEPAWWAEGRGWGERRRGE